MDYSFGFSLLGLSPCGFIVDTQIRMQILVLFHSDQETLQSKETLRLVINREPAPVIPSLNRRLLPQKHNMDSSLSNPSSAGGTELSTEIQSSEILPRLPAESLMRFRQVCKSWCSLICEPSFVKAHYRHFPLRQDHTHLFLTTSSGNSEPCQHFFSLQINRKGQLTLPTHILTLPASNFSFFRGTHSVNGLILLSEPCSQSEHAHIVNPCTREVITLPRASTCDKVVHRLGFSELTNEYKVLQVHKIVHETGTKLKLKIFSLGSTSLWRDLDLDHLPFNPKSLNFSRRSVWLRGGIHWMHEDENVIVVFDFRDERFRVIPFPIHAGNYPSLELIEVNGYICGCI
uniref:F-box protein At3g07870-like n=1 Tax=Fragaria vesca subsp. vesca TaxID=101020 RepID=UPI0005CA733D|nr:PREDICTED: F-box protein At3g07870-like [Fragaria vesca subsp. vesca]